MKMESRQKRRGNDKDNKIIKSSKLAKINFELAVLNMMCNFVVSANKNIKRSHLVHMRNLFESIDYSIYINDQIRCERIRFIKAALSIRLEKGNINPALLICGASDGFLGSPETAFTDFMELSNVEIDYINELVSGALKCTFLEESVDRGLDILTRYKAEDYRYRSDIIKEWEDFIKEENARIRAAKASSTCDMVFDLRSDNFESSLYDIYDTLTSSTRRLFTGMQGFNMLIGGSLESTRCYLLLGNAGVGKSMMLLNLAMQIKKYNRNYVPKDPTKIPTILYLTQENMTDETVERMFSIVSGGGRFQDYTKEQVRDILVEQGEMVLTDESNINIMVMYKPDKSIDTGDLYTIVEDLEDDGYEVILLLQDHVKRIRSAYKERQSELRIELGEVINELKVFGQIKDIPVVTVGHLNRDAAKIVDDNVRGNKADLTRLLGRSNVGESYLMIDNADCVIIMNKEYDQDGNMYLGLNQVKLRNYLSMITYLCQPYDPNSPAKLIDDLWGVPVHRETLAGPLQMRANGSPNSSLRNSAYKIVDEEDDNIFESKTTFITPGTVLPTTASLVTGNPTPVQFNMVNYNDNMTEDELLSGAAPIIKPQDTCYHSVIVPGPIATLIA